MGQIMTNRSRRLAFVSVGTILVGLGVCVWVYNAEIAAGDRRVREFWGDIDEGYSPQTVLEPLPPLENPTTVPGAEVGEKIQPQELVLGVAIHGEAKAYPINMLTGPQREIFNDELGGQSIAATW